MQRCNEAQDSVCLQHWHECGQSNYMVLNGFKYTNIIIWIMCLSKGVCKGADIYFNSILVIIKTAYKCVTRAVGKTQCMLMVNRFHVFLKFRDVFVAIFLQKFIMDLHFPCFSEILEMFCSDLSPEIYLFFQIFSRNYISDFFFKIKCTKELNVRFLQKCNLNWNNQ